VLDSQLLLPGSLQRPGDESMLRFNRMVLTSRSLDVIGGSFSPLRPVAIQLGTLLLQSPGGGQR